jgi:hypothetical protein
MTSTPGLNPFTWINARDCITIDRAPPILGIGFLYHYVVPEQYWWWECKAFGLTTFVQRESYCNWGAWGPKDKGYPEFRKWYTAYFTFDGLRLQFF